MCKIVQTDKKAEEICSCFDVFCVASSQFHASLLITSCAVMYIIPLCKTTIINITLFVGNSIFERIKIRSANNLPHYENVQSTVDCLICKWKYWLRTKRIDCALKVLLAHLKFCLRTKSIGCALKVVLAQQKYSLRTKSLACALKVLLAHLN